MCVLSLTHGSSLISDVSCTSRDTAGQERFNSITSAYYRGAKGIVLVYDITKQETFDDLPKWMKMIDKYASEEAELLLVGNKLDCETDRIITKQTAERFTSRISGMRFCEASAKDNFNVEECFLKLVDDILAKVSRNPPCAIKLYGANFVDLRPTLCGQNIRNTFPFRPQNSLTSSGAWDTTSVSTGIAGSMLAPMLPTLAGCPLGGGSFWIHTGKLLSVKKNPAALQFLTQTVAPGTYYHTQFKGTFNILS
ncbi:unnamed protein product [Oncorhynchus mykiss]|uniref:small monomeric GTPase n=1 Tax=Oncorhynchus mykiss TaxID=8022 RepID=A0A060YI99_ONCMY|nr:unnamed protein product [Oncorhynchus mykiss]